jgi:outer membrane protein assembly factor BamB
MGISTDAPPMAWSDKQNVCWRVELPDHGISTPIVWGDQVFITQATQNDHRRSVICFDRKDGKQLWQSGVAYSEPEPTNGQNPYCASSPATDGQRIIACFGTPGLYCYDFDGKELWHRELGKADSWHGSGSSPVIFGDLCYINFGPGTNEALVACNKQTGEVAWKVAAPRSTIGAVTSFLFGGVKPPTTQPAGRGGADPGLAGAAMAGDFSGAGGFTGSWSTPIFTHVGDHDELILSHATQLSAYDPRAGKEIWVFKGFPEQVCTSPVVSEGMVVAAGKRVSGGTDLYGIKLGGTGDVTATHRAWQTHLPKDCVGSPVAASGRVYLATQFGSLICLDLATGKKLYESRLQGAGNQTGSWSSIVLAGDKLLVPNQNGEVFIIKASSQFEQIGVNSIGEETTCSSLALADGQVFLRTYKALWCLGRNKSE